MWLCVRVCVLLRGDMCACGNEYVVITDDVFRVSGFVFNGALPANSAAAATVVLRRCQS